MFVVIIATGVFYGELDINKEFTLPHYKGAELSVVAKKSDILSPSSPLCVNNKQFRVTFYDSCPICCGQYAYNRPLDENGNEIVYTASGAIAQSLHTIAVDTSIIPFGTKLMIDGFDCVFVAEDRGVSGYAIDVYCDSHEEACNMGGVLYRNITICER